MPCNKSGSLDASMLDKPHAEVTQRDGHVRGAQLSQTRHQVSEQSLKMLLLLPAFEPMETGHTGNQILNS